jgi:pimeloyl-ACP methyl ester carboxylesterase
MKSIDWNFIELCSFPSASIPFSRKGPVMRPSIAIVVAFLLLSNLMTYADGPADNKEEAVRSVPPPGIAISDELREELASGLRDLQTRLDVLRKSKSAMLLKYLPDVEIFEKAIRIALTEDGFFEPKDFEGAKRVLAEGRRRMQLLLEEKPDWLKPTDQRDITTVRGFRSRIDGSVQPYGVVRLNSRMATYHGRTDVWCRGRSEKGLEMQFLAQRLVSKDPQPAPGVLMIHPFGRYCNANKLAGEIDTLEALEHAIAEYEMDPEGVAIRGFSMGGAAAWHLAVHYPDRWFAANPGAGFSETPKFLNVFQSETLAPASYEKTLWNLYDCPNWALNLRNVPTIAYSGEIDRQKQAADVMAEACWNLPVSQSFELAHIVAPKTAHKVDPIAGKEIERRLDRIYHSKSQDVRKKIWFATYSLKYNRCHWLTIDRLEEHWKQATVTASLSLEGFVPKIDIEAHGVNAFSLDFDIGEIPGNYEHIQVLIQGDLHGLHPVSKRSDGSWHVSFERTVNDRSERWTVRSPLAAPMGIVKRKDLQGPIDDAFMSSFLFIKPSGAGQHPAVDQWVQSEFDRAIREWHRQMRGDVRVISSDQLQESDIEANNIVLWGDPKSNPKIAEILNSLPLKWDASKVTMQGQSFGSETHIPVLIYPNPLNSNKYVVLNSSFTYREYDYLNNARQVPKLPDWAIIDIRTPSGSRWSGKVAAANFFDETWKVKN